MIEMETLIEKLKQEARDSWSGDTGEDRAERLECFVRTRAASYAEKMGCTPAQVLNAWESNRQMSAVNYYQDAKFPSLDRVRIFKSFDEMKALCPSKKFRCPMCKGESTDPYECDTKLPMDKQGNPCDWKSYGLFRTMGKGLLFTFADDFLESGCRIDEIFMPVELEGKEN